jgi:hypothetical protein
MRALSYSEYGAPDDVSAAREIDAIEEAFEPMAYLEQGHARGKIAIAVSEPDG